MDWGELLFSLLVDLVVTTLFYLLVPVVLCVRHKPLTKEQIKKIVIINGVVVWLVFRIISMELTGEAGTGAAVFLWSAVANWLLKKYCLKNEMENVDYCEEQDNKTQDDKPIKDEEQGNKKTDKDDITNQTTALDRFLDERHSFGATTVIATDVFDKPKAKTPSKNKIFTITIVSIVVIAIIIALAVILAANNNYKELGVTPEQYTIATMIADDPQAYCKYISELDATLAKGTYGNDLKVEKATEYINKLPLDYGQKIILFRIQFPKDTTYNSDIVDYLNERDDITYDEMAYILEELGFAVFDDGTVKW